MWARVLFFALLISCDARRLKHRTALPSSGRENCIDLNLGGKDGFLSMTELLGIGRGIANAIIERQPYTSWDDMEEKFHAENHKVKNLYKRSIKPMIESNRERFCPFEAERGDMHVSSSHNTVSRGPKQKDNPDSVSDERTKKGSEDGCIDLNLGGRDGFLSMTEMLGIGRGIANAIIERQPYTSWEDMKDKFHAENHKVKNLYERSIKPMIESNRERFCSFGSDIEVVQPNQGELEGECIDLNAGGRDGFMAMTEVLGIGRGIANAIIERQPYTSWKNMKDKFYAGNHKVKNLYERSIKPMIESNRERFCPF